MITSGYHTPSAGLKVVDLTEERAAPATPESVEERERDLLLKKSLARFKRNRSAPDELEDLRYRLIVARVSNGLLAVEAAKKFGYANSTQLSLIESGERPPPTDWKFLRQAAEVYSVSVDWLLGLTHHMEPDHEILRRHALLRGTISTSESLINGFAKLSAQVAGHMQLSPGEVSDLISALESIEWRFRDLSERGEFDDLPGGAPVAAAIAALSRVSAPLHRVRASFTALNDYLGDVEAGRLPKIDTLSDRFKPQAHAREVLLGQSS